VTIQFLAALQGAGCLRFDDDGSATIKLTCDGSQLAQVTKLFLLQGQTFVVRIAPGEHGGPDR
jgi:hypothetical protein